MGLSAASDKPQNLKQLLDSTYREAAKVNRQTRKALMEIKEESDGIERLQEWKADAEFWRFVRPFKSSKPNVELANT